MNEFFVAVDWDSVRRAVVARASSTLGRALAGSLAPLATRDEILASRVKTEEARKLIERGAAPAVTRLADIGWIFERSRKTERLLDPRELSLIAACARAGEAAREVLADAADAPSLRALLEGIDFDAALEVAVAIEAAIEDDEVKPDATPAFVELGKRAKDAKDQLREATLAATRSPTVLSALAVPHPVERSGRTCLAVRAVAAGRVEGTLVDREPNGQVLYVEPAIARDASNLARQLELELLAEANRIIGQLDRKARTARETLVDLASRLARLDFHLALGRYGHDLDMVSPEVDEGGRLALHAARHPVLDARARETSGRCVPIDIELGPDRSLLVVSGPNGGGKTVALKTAALLALLAQSGAQIPAATGSRVPIFAEFLSVVGERDSLETGVSTFEAHARGLATLVRDAGERSLVVIDEIGLGTDPTEASALGRAVLELLLARRARTIVTTHLRPLKEFAERAEGAANASVELDPDGHPTYRLTVGRAGESSAFVMARRAGIPEAIVARAEELLHGPSTRDRVAVPRSG